MKVVLWVGGVGTQISEESSMRPQTMVEIGGTPILCMAYYFLYTNDVTFNYSKDGKIIIHRGVMDRGPRPLPDRVYRMYAEMGLST